MTLFLGSNRAEWVLWCPVRVRGFWSSFRRVCLRVDPHHRQGWRPVPLVTSPWSCQCTCPVSETDAIVTGVCFNHVTSRGQSLRACREVLELLLWD